MPLRRFRDMEEARRALWLDPSDPALVSRIRRVWAFSLRLAGRRIPPGVRKFRSIAQANAEREAWIEKRVEAIRAGRG